MKFRLDEFRHLIAEAIRKAYEILGVDPAASPEEIKRAYRVKAMELHPDRNSGRDTSADIVKVNVAYGLLSDPEKRKRYDLVGDKTLGDAGSSGAGPRASNSNNWWEDFVRGAKTAGYNGRGPQPHPPGAHATDNHAAKDRQQKQARADADDRDWKRDRQTPPSAPKPVRRYFTSTQGTSRKFWWIERNGRHVVVGWGKLRTPNGQQKAYNFDDHAQANKFMMKMIVSKLNKGYVEKSVPWSQQQAPAPKPEEKKQPEPAPQAKSSSKTTYKIYGKKGKAPAHTRYQGHVYVGGPDTKFKAGGKATVAAGTDGRLAVHDPETGHTQHWNREAFEREVLEKLVEALNVSD